MRSACRRLAKTYDGTNFLHHLFSHFPFVSERPRATRRPPLGLDGKGSNMRSLKRRDKWVSIQPCDAKREVLNYFQKETKNKFEWCVLVYEKISKKEMQNRSWKVRERFH